MNWESESDQTVLRVVTSRLPQIWKAIEAYDLNRPLNAAARVLQGLPMAMDIMINEGDELRELLTDTDKIPVDQLNGQRSHIFNETGDVMFGLAEVLKYCPFDELTSEQQRLFLDHSRLVLGTEQHYQIDLVQAGIHVNQEKNARNNPTWSQLHHHPLDRNSVVFDSYEHTRRGLRIIRNSHPTRILSEDNLQLAIDFFGYTGGVLRETPALAAQFFRQVAINGLGNV